MFATYLTVTLLTAALSAAAAVANLLGLEYPKTEAARNRVPVSWVRPLGALLGAGALGLLAGIVVPLLGVLAATGLVLYFLGALGAHVRAGNYRLGAWAVFFVLSSAAFAVNVLHHAGA